jgi:hypothetical protein
MFPNTQTIIQERSKRVKCSGGMYAAFFRECNVEKLLDQVPPPSAQLPPCQGACVDERGGGRLE